MIDLLKDGFNDPLEMVNEARLAFLDNEGRFECVPPPHETMPTANKAIAVYFKMSITFIASLLLMAVDRKNYPRF